MKSARPEELPATRCWVRVERRVRPPQNLGAPKPGTRLSSGAMGWERRTMLPNPKGRSWSYGPNGGAGTMDEQRRGSNDDDSPANKGEQMIQGAGAVTQFRKGWDCQMTRTWALRTYTK